MSEFYDPFVASPQGSRWHRIRLFTESRLFVVTECGLWISRFACETANAIPGEAVCKRCR